MFKYYPDMTHSIVEYIKQLKIVIFGTVKGFHHMPSFATNDGMPCKNAKEFKGLAKQVLTGREGGDGFRAKAFIDLNVTREEVAEVLALAVNNGGGSSFVYTTNALPAGGLFLGGVK